MENTFLRYNFATGEISSLAPLGMANGQRSASNAFVSIPSRDVVWLLDLAYVSIRSCRADWHAANGQVADVPAEVGNPSVDIAEMDHLALLLEKDAG